MQIRLGYCVLAEAFEYPSSGLASRLERCMRMLPPGAEKDGLQTFLRHVTPLSQGAWEELYTHTWDLDPLTPPYIGFQIWGEDYRRGNFLALLQAAYREAGVQTGGELPDHLVPVLKYLGTIPNPVAELNQVFSQAVQKMAAALAKREADNPYLHLLSAIDAAAARDLPSAMNPSVNAGC